jgi:hypothetical protein
MRRHRSALEGLTISWTRIVIYTALAVFVVGGWAAFFTTLLGGP